MRKLLLLGLFSLLAVGCGDDRGAAGPSTGTGGANTGGTNGSAGTDTGGAKSGGSGTGGRSSAAGAGTGGRSSTAGAGTGGASGAAGAGTGGAGQATDDCVPLPENSRIYDHILNLVDPDVTAALTEYLQQPVVLADGQEPLELDFPSRVFYELYPDEYDFLVFLA